MTKRAIIIIYCNEQYVNVISLNTFYCAVLTLLAMI